MTVGQPRRVRWAEEKRKGFSLGSARELRNWDRGGGREGDTDGAS